MKKVITKMTAGGASNGSFRKNLDKTKEDFISAKVLGIFGPVTIIFKKIIKIQTSHLYYSSPSDCN